MFNFHLKTGHSTVFHSQYNEIMLPQMPVYTLAPGLFKMKECTRRITQTLRLCVPGTTCFP